MSTEDFIESAHETVIDDDIVEQLQRRFEAEERVKQEAHATELALIYGV